MMPIELSVTTAQGIALDERASMWFGALWRAERTQHDACHANLLAWIMALPTGLDPAEAANAVISYQERETDQVLSAPLTALLHNVARYPTQRLNRLRRRRRQIEIAH